ncbi:G protein pathway suppressor 2-like isoform X1 [Alosa sapidissima]|uniref:G protein pathway suppressor 2-like isoform X1 n=1 Tax=Alosa sapidissima TaxID=34773 RepID=UPI001C097269|nr:G protein pathway suppressor 2-like isoform X1 [Alosa sapidissima]
MPALLERPKLSNAMARALHKHIMRERERKRQEEEEVDKMMEQKMKEEEERKRTKEMEERMSLEETKEQVQKMGEKLQGLQEEKHQLFLQLKKVLHEEEKRRRKEQRISFRSGPFVSPGSTSRLMTRCYTNEFLDGNSQMSCDITTLTSASYQSSIPMHGQHLLSMQGSPVGHSRSGGLLADRSKQLFQTPVIPGRPFPGQAGFSTGSSEHGQFTAGQSVHEPYVVTTAQHPSSYAASSSVPISFASSSQIRGASAFQAMQYLPHQPQGFAVHAGHFSSQPGFIPSAGIPLQKQLEHANQQSGFTDSGTLRSIPPQALHVSAAGLLPTPSMAVQIPSAKASFPASAQPAPRHALFSHTQPGQRFYHHSK